jgi:hypothetical protein
MKKSALITISLCLIAMMSCQDQFTEIFTGNSPVYMSYEDLRKSISQSGPEELVNPGKIYFKDNLIFIVEEMKGIHVINNANPANPVNLTYIHIPGAVDIAVKDQVMYCDSYVDVVALDITDIMSVKEVDRVTDVLPYSIPAYDTEYPIATIDEDKGVVVDWEIKRIKQPLETYNYPIYGWEDAWVKDNSTGGISQGGSGGGVGVGGSMARFGITGTTLYAVDNMDLHIFSISNPQKLVLRREFNAGWTIETMFILGTNMFLGTQSGMRIFDISTPTSPMYVSDFWHLTGCDPVVVREDLAFVTLRGGNACGNNVNQLVVLSVKDIQKPVELRTYPMENPYGLGVDGNTLFICDGFAGLKIYDITDPLSINKHLLAHFPDIQTYDAIPLDGVLMLIGDDGLYQYDYTMVSDIRLLSKIEVRKTGI